MRCKNFKIGETGIEIFIATKFADMSIYRSNRTFMELKSDSLLSADMANQVLIAPLWN